MTASGEVIHFSVVEQALVRCSKKAGRQTFGQPRKGLYSFGKDYVCSVSAAKDSLNVYLENNPRYPVKYVLVLKLEWANYLSRTNWESLPVYFNQAQSILKGITL